MHYKFNPMLTARVAVNPEEYGRLENMIALLATRYADCPDPQAAEQYVREVDLQISSIVCGAITTARISNLKIDYLKSEHGVVVADCHDLMALERFLVIFEEVA